MKLRNKKTGEIAEGYVRVGIQNNGKFPNPIEYHTYISFAELCEDWEDYNPTEPLIKDEKIRKAVRAWAEAFGVTNVYVYGIGDGKDYIELYAQDNGVTDGRIRISISTQNGVWIGKEYTIDELCGEEEE